MVNNEVTTDVLKWEQVKQNIREWNRIRRSPSDVKPLFIGETYFEFQAKPLVSSEPIALHFYPAVISPTELVIYVIRTEFDKKEVYEADKENFAEKYISVAPLMRASMNEVHGTIHGISRQDALQRIRNWDNYHDLWIDERAPTGDGIFQAFYMTPSSNQDLAGGIRGFFGLQTAIPPFDFNADLVLQNIDTQLYYNTVRPVPPYPAGEPMEKFFLLIAATT